MGKSELHDIVADFKRVARELGRQPSRNEYREKGRYTHHAIDKEFGSWLEFLAAVGAKPSTLARGKEKDPLEKKLAAYGNERKLIHKFESELKPYHGKFLNKHKADRVILSASDFHDEFCDKFALSVFLDVAKLSQPDTICLAGDMVDWPEVSRFDRDPSRVNNMQGAIDWVVDLFKELRSRCPNAEIFYILGNHELRLFKYLCAFPGMMGLRNIQFDQLFEAEKYGINLICRKSFLVDAPKKASNYYVFDDCLVAFHGAALSKYHAHVLLSRFGKSGFSGHVHNRQYASTKDLNSERFWVSLPTMANYELSKEYMEMPDNWCNGFSFFYIDKQRPLEVPVTFNNGFACWAGKIYRRLDGL